MTAGSYRSGQPRKEHVFSETQCSCGFVGQQVVINLSRLQRNRSFHSTRECKPRGVFFKPRFTGLTASKPGYPGLIMSVRRAACIDCLYPPMSVEYLRMSEIRDIEKVANSYTVM